MKQILEDMKIQSGKLISMLCDYTSAISVSKILVMYSNTKKLPIKYHFLRERVEVKKVKLEYINSKE